VIIAAGCHAKTPKNPRGAGLKRLLLAVRQRQRVDSPEETLIYRRTKNLRAAQILLGHTKLASAVCYLGIEVDDALKIVEQREI